MNRKKAVSVLMLAVVLLLTPAAGYAGSAIPLPAATGKSTVRNDAAEIDVSNAQDGYVMIRYLKITAKALRVIINGPGKAPYIYRLDANGAYEVFPLSDGDGHYRITVYENVYGDKYSAVLSAARNVRLADAFAPFLLPNQYVNYSGGGRAAKTAAKLTENLTGTPDKISAIYHYVVENISYDRQLAETIQAGYLPDVDKVLKKGKGVCFDYAAVTAAMLRSQGIPAKLVVGYRGKAYHAWVSVYSGEAGRVNNTIYLKENSWTRLDPTFAAAYSSGLLKYMGDGAVYSSKFFY